MTAFGKRRPLLSLDDHAYFTRLLKAYRRFDPIKWRTAVRETSEGCVSRDALMALCGVLVDYEELRVTKAKNIELNAEVFDYGAEVGTAIRSEMAPLPHVTLGVLLKFLAAVLREKHKMMLVAKDELYDYKQIVERSWIRKLRDLVAPLLRRITG